MNHTWYEIVIVPSSYTDFFSNQNSAKYSMTSRFWDNVPLEKAESSTSPTRWSQKLQDDVPFPGCYLNYIMVTMKQTQVADIAVYSRTCFYEVDPTVQSFTIILLGTLIDGMVWMSSPPSSGVHVILMARSPIRESDSDEVNPIQSRTGYVLRNCPKRVTS